MISLPRSLDAWGQTHFQVTLKSELEQFDAAALPLQQALTRTSHVAASPHQVSILDVSAEPGLIRTRAGIFYAGIVAGCSCADDPSAIDEQPEYCELRVDIDRSTAAATVMLLTETD